MANGTPRSGDLDKGLDFAKGLDFLKGLDFAKGLDFLKGLDFAKGLDFEKSFGVVLEKGRAALHEIEELERRLEARGDEDAAQLGIHAERARRHLGTLTFECVKLALAGKLNPGTAPPGGNNGHGELHIHLHVRD